MTQQFLAEPLVVFYDDIFTFCEYEFLDYDFIFILFNLFVHKNGPAVNRTRSSSVFGVAATALKLNNFTACKRGILPLDYRPLFYLSLNWFLNFYFIIKMVCRNNIVIL